MRSESQASTTWQRVALKELIRVHHGFAFRGEFFRDRGPGDILLTPGNFAVHGGFTWHKPKYYVGPVDARFVLRTGDLIITMTDLSKASDTLGAPVIVPPAPEGSRLLHNQRLGRVEIVASERVSGPYLYAVLRSRAYRRQVIATATGTTVRHTSPQRIGEARIPLPPISEQRRIASILGVLDSKIDSNRRLAGLLEETAANLFRGRFVDFVGVERFQDSELGRIPRGWRVGPLSDVCEHRPGKLLRPDGYASDGSFPVYGSNSVMGRSATFLYEGPLTVLARIGSNCGALRWSAEACWVNNNASALIACSGIEPHWLHQTLATLDYSQFRRGSGQPFLAVKELMGHPIGIPPSVERESAGRFLGPIEAHQTRLASEAETLAAIRDELLPKLVSAEIRVPATADPDEAVETVAAAGS